MSRAGVSSGYIKKVTVRYRPHMERSKGGRPRRLNFANVRYVVRLVTNARKDGTRQVCQYVLKLARKKVSSSTARRALKEAGLRAIKKVQGPRLTPK
ncbi:hypothetical protein OPQ81_002583 [Rhizoctonia solani]|nr:hypothetical protein OPQ81_002583 [Rhizoctonia solani]